MLLKDNVPAADCSLQVISDDVESGTTVVSRLRAFSPADTGVYSLACSDDLANPLATTRLTVTELPRVIESDWHATTQAHEAEHVSLSLRFDQPVDASAFVVLKNDSTPSGVTLRNADDCTLLVELPAVTCEDAGTYSLATNAEQPVASTRLTITPKLRVLNSSSWPAELHVPHDTDVTLTLTLNRPPNAASEHLIVRKGSQPLPNTAVESVECSVTVRLGNVTQQDSACYTLVLLASPLGADNEEKCPEEPLASTDLKVDKPVLPRVIASGKSEKRSQRRFCLKILDREVQSSTKAQVSFIWIQIL